ncbi:Tex family protein [candidate division KSB1 bacterium]
MNEKHISKITGELNLKEWQVSAAAALLEDDATIPFIARYRKEATGTLDEVEIMKIRDRLNQLKELDKRREAILKSLEERELLTDELKEKILAAETMSVLEDIYLPFRPKRRTRATAAREKGLEPLAELIFKQEDIDINSEAEKFINEEKDVKTIEDALQGARDIIAETVNEDQESRAEIRKLFLENALISSRVITGKEEEGIKYKDYFDWQEPITKVPSHRLLAMRRGEKELLLSLSILPDEKEAVSLLEKRFLKNDNMCSENVREAVHDSYKRLLSASMETEIRMISKSAADEEAINVFADNLKQLLLAPPLGQKRMMAVDPGFRTGCKVVCLDSQGKLLHNTAIYPHEPQNKKDEAAKIIKELCSKYEVEYIAVGNGTAGRETEDFIRSLDMGNNISVVMVNESGASVYSASEAAREEFPDFDVTVRGAVSIGRRLQDPLAELVKIDPKSIGVGQYQHDVDQKLLKEKLDDDVMSSVNMVGVELNTASKQLLTYVSGLGSKLAKSIVEFRDKNGPFKSRKALKKVPGLGPKAFEQSAGFLRISNAANPLDGSAVHPESYPIVEKMAEDAGCSVAELMKDELLHKRFDLKKYVTEKVGLPTLNDIITELSKPGRDPRDKFEAFEFQDGVNSIEDVKPGMKLPGIVTNITNFGAFVDIGVHQDGLVHISEIADKFVKNPADEVKLQQQVAVTVLDVDVARRRIALSMKNK